MQPDSRQATTQGRVTGTAAQAPSRFDAACLPRMPGRSVLPSPEAALEGRVVLSDACINASVPAAEGRP